MFEVILDFFDGLGEHEFVLRDLHFHPSSEIVKALVNFDDFLEVQFFEIDVHPSDQKIDQISLLKFVISKAAQSFQHFRHLSVKIVEALYLGDTLAVAVQEICVAGHRHQLCFELLIGSAL